MSQVIKIGSNAANCGPVRDTQIALGVNATNAESFAPFYTWFSNFICTSLLEE